MTIQKVWLITCQPLPQDTWLIRWQGSTGSAWDEVLRLMGEMQKDTWEYVESVDAFSIRHNQLLALLPLFSNSSEWMVPPQRTMAAIQQIRRRKD